MVRGPFHWSAPAAITYGAVLIAVTAITDWRVEINATLGFLYIFPMVLLGTALDWWQVILAALFCTLLSDRLDPFPMEMEVARDVLIFLTLAVTGLLSLSLTKSYRREKKGLEVQRAAEEQLRFLIESSPAAIFTMTAGGEILLGNPAAHRLLGVANGSLSGKRIAGYIPALGAIPSSDETTKIFRTEMQTRANGITAKSFGRYLLFHVQNGRLPAACGDGGGYFRTSTRARGGQPAAASRRVSDPGRCRIP